MGYLIGAGPLDPAVERYNGGTSSFTMDNSGTTNGTLLWVDGVAQVPGTDYNVSGTTITTTTAAGAGTNNVTSLQLFNTGLINTPADNTVATAKIQDDAITLAKMAAGTDGQIITYDASGNPAAVGPGSDGQVLTSTGAGSPPAFEAAAGGAWQVVSTVSVSDVASVTIAVDNTYDRYEVHISNLLVVDENKELYLRVGDSSGIDSGSTDYNHGIAGYSVNSHVAANEAQIAMQNYYNIGAMRNGTAEGGSAELCFDYPTGSRHFACFGRVSCCDDAGGMYDNIFAGNREADITLTQIQFFMASGNITSGRFTLLGLKHA